MPTSDLKRYLQNDSWVFGNPLKALSMIVLTPVEGAGDLTVTVVISGSCCTHKTVFL